MRSFITGKTVAFGVHQGQVRDEDKKALADFFGSEDHAEELIRILSTPEGASNADASKFLRGVNKDPRGIMLYKSTPGFEDDKSAEGDKSIQRYVLTYTVGDYGDKQDIDQMQTCRPPQPK